VTSQEPGSGSDSGPVPASAPGSVPASGQRPEPRRPLTLVSDVLDVGCRVLTGLLLAGIVCSNAAEVVLRTVFATTLNWIFEVNLLAATWIYFLGVCQVYHRRGDIAVDALTRFLPREMRVAWGWVVDLLSVTTFGIIGWYGIRLMELQWPFRTPGVRLPSALYSAPVVIGAVVMIVHVVALRLRDPRHLSSAG
jgi:TRAP-type C4-dicarboxylate transport system permease small subunit